MVNSYIFTSESVSEGHPDKLCDQISDAILDACLKQDENSRVACECAVKSNEVFLLGEITSNAKVDYEEVVRQTIKDIGYDSVEKGINYSDCVIHKRIEAQSPDINQGVDKKRSASGSLVEIGAGDQGIMFGYATDETEELMPLTLSLAQKLTQRLAKVRKENIIPYLRPDGKSQVSVKYVDNKPSEVTAVVISTQHDPDIPHEKISLDVLEQVIKPIIPSELLTESTSVYINPTGSFVIGGPKGDAGLTGRKIIVDTYGGHGAHGGGAFSGKDSTKVDRSAAYMARHIAKNIVAAGLAKKCLLQLSYAIGVSDPTSIYVDCYGTETQSKEKIVDAIKKIFPLTPLGIINYLDLTKPVFKQTAAYGHFGRTDIDLTWERTDKVEELKKFFS